MDMSSNSCDESWESNSSHAPDVNPPELQFKNLICWEALCLGIAGTDFAVCSYICFTPMTPKC